MGSRDKEVNMFPEKYFLISDYQSMEVLGVNGLFTNLRVDASSLPEGFHKYSIREGADDPFASVKKNVFANHMGDFICKQELDLQGEESRDLLEDYCFTDAPVDLDKFFGEDRKGKIAEALDQFCHDFDPYEYQDNLARGFSRQDVIDSVQADLSDKARVNGMIAYFNNILENNKEEHFLSAFDEQTVRSFIAVLTELNRHNRDTLDNIVGKAEAMKQQAGAVQPGPGAMVPQEETKP